jgi:hypothetical protein
VVVSLVSTRLYELLPAVYRVRDDEAGGPLEALFAVLAAQSDVVERNIEQLYDDQFIETCAPWVIPYIGDLIGYGSIYEVASASADSRAEVANTIGYRRRKGTLLALEQMASDVSGRTAFAVEEFRRLITTESMRHIQPRRHATVDLRDGRALARLHTPFDREHRTIDVRRIAPRFRAAERPDTAPLDIALHGPGRFNLPDVAIHLWRCERFEVNGQPAFAVGGGRYLFSPLGANLPLFPKPTVRQAFASLTTRADTAEPIARDELLDFYGTSLALVADGTAVDAARIYPANLADRPGGAWCTVPSGLIAVDPELGRIQYASDVPEPRSLTLDYVYGFPAEIGGGPYDRSAALAQIDLTSATVYTVGSSAYPTLESAVTAWNALAPGATGVIVLNGFESFTIDLTGPGAVNLPAGSSLSILAGSPAASGGGEAWTNSRVTLIGDVELVGVAGAPGADPPPPAGRLLINGVWLAGQVAVTGAPTTVQICDSTLVPGLGLLTGGEPLAPGEPSVVVDALGTTLILTRAITGALAVDASGTTRICRSIVDATSCSHVAYAGADFASAGADLHVEDSTIVGKVRARTLTLASNTIFHARLGLRDPWPAAVWASRKQAGCVRFCVLPYDSITPRRYNCLPPDAASEPALEPMFVTLRYGQPAYALLSGDCPVAIWTGADNGSQIGAYLQIQETEAIANVQLRAPEYLPALLESGVFIHPSRARRRRPGPAPGYGYGHWPQLTELERLPGIGAELI